MLSPSAGSVLSAPVQASAAPPGSPALIQAPPASNRVQAEEYFRQAEQMVGTGDENSERQIQLLEKALQLDPTMLAPDLNLGLIYSRLSDPARALTHFNRLLEKTTPDTPLHRNTLYLAAVNLKVLGKNAEAMEQAKKVIALDPKHADALSFLGSLYLEEGKLEEAKAIYEKAIEANPNFADGYYNLAFLAQKTGNGDLALQYYQKFADLRPADGKVQLNAAVLLAGADRVREAARYAEQATKTDPENADAWTELGKIQSLTDRRDESLQSFRRAIAIRPKWSEAHRLLVAALLTSRGTVEAEQVLTEAEKSSPDEAELHAMKGRLAERQDNSLFMLKGYGRAFELEPTAPRAFDFAMGYLRAQALPLAEDYLVKAVALDPGFIEAWINLAAVRDRQQKATEALAAFHEAEKLGLRDGAAFFRMGMLYARLKQADKALVYLGRSVEIEPTRWKAALREQLKAVTSDLDSIRYKAEFQKLLE